MRTTRLTAALAAISLVIGVRLQAQPRLEPGTRIRALVADTTPVTFPPPAGPRAVSPEIWRIGSVVATTPTTLTLATAQAGRSEALPFAAIARIDVSHGRPSYRRRGAIIGGLLGGAAFTGLACGFSDGSCSIGNDVGGFLLYFATGAIPGAFAGSAIGARSHGPERWEPVWTAPAPSSDGGVALRR